MHQTYVDQGNSDNSEGMKELNENERSAGDGNESSCASRLEPLGTGSEKKCNEGNQAYLIGNFTAVCRSSCYQTCFPHKISPQRKY